MTEAELRPIIRRSAERALARHTGQQPSEKDVAQLTDEVVSLFVPAARPRKTFAWLVQLFTTFVSSSLTLQMWSVSPWAMAGVSPLSDLC